MPAAAVPASLWESRRDRGVYAERWRGRASGGGREQAKGVGGDRDRGIDKERGWDVTG